MNSKNNFLNNRFLNCIFLSTLMLLTPLFVIAQVINPHISIRSSQDPAGIKINISGKGFTRGSTATFYTKNPDGSQSVIQYSDSLPDGSFNISHIFPTGYPPGTYHLWAVDGATGKYSNTTDFNMPAIQSTEVRIPPPPYTPSYLPQHGDLIRAKGDKKIYLIHNLERRAIVTGKVFKQMGFKWSDVKEIDPQDLMIIPEGSPIWSREVIAPFPEGTLIRLKGTTRTHVIQGGRKCYIPDPETFHARGYKWDQVKEVDQATLDSILTGIPIPSMKPPFQYGSPGQPSWGQPPPPGRSPFQPLPPSPPPSPWQPSPYGGSTTPPSTGPTPYQPQSSSTILPDGTLIKGSGPGIYLIENGVRRLMPDVETFNAMGFNWNNVINVDDQRLGALPLGSPLPFKKILGR